jgi:hypothetical protein
MSTEIIVAIISGIFALLVPVVYWLLDRWRGRGGDDGAGAPIPGPSISQPKSLNWRIPVVSALFGTVLGYIIGLYFASSFPVQPPTPPTPTPIPRGELILEINFDMSGDGGCNEKPETLLGYEKSQYFIQPEPNGYIAICHAIDDLTPQGSLEVDAWSEQEIKNIYGYALLFGWEGKGYVTTDACIMGIRRNGAVTEAFYEIRQSGERQAYTQEVRTMTIDNARHNLRIVLSDGRAFGYLDERLFGVYQFNDCNSGPVGMVAWGPGDQKIYFDDLKLYSLP